MIVYRLDVLEDRDVCSRQHAVVLGVAFLQEIVPEGLACGIGGYMRQGVFGREYLCSIGLVDRIDRSCIEMTLGSVRIGFLGGKEQGIRGLVLEGMDVLGEKRTDLGVQGEIPCSLARFMLVYGDNGLDPIVFKIVDIRKDEMGDVVCTPSYLELQGEDRCIAQSILAGGL